MVEYLYNTIRATAGDVMSITALIADDNGNDITEACHFMLYDNDENLLVTAHGEYKDNEWAFNVPTTGLSKGKYWYCICYQEEKLCFLERLYLI